MLNNFKKREVDRMPKGIRRLFPILLILAFVSPAVLEGKETSADDQKKHPVVLNPKKLAQLGGVRQEVCIKDVFSRKILFYEPKEDVQISIDSNENIYVVDRELALIKVFDKNGTLLHQLGGKGEESGKMIFPTNLLITSQDEILIKDKAKFRLNLFSLQGKILRSISYSIQNLGKIRLNSKGNIIADSFINEGSKSLFEISQYDKEFNLIKRLVSWDVTDVFKEPELLYFGRYIDWEIMRDDKIVMGMSDKYIFHIYSPDGNIIKEFKKEFDPARISYEEKEKELNRAHPSAKERLKKMVYHKAFQYFTIDNKNRIIVRTWEKTADKINYYYDVFNSEGVYISRFWGNFSIKKWINGKFLAVEDLPDGNSVLKIYEVIWN